MDIFKRRKVLWNRNEETIESFTGNKMMPNIKNHCIKKKNPKQSEQKNPKPFRFKKKN